LDEFNLMFITVENNTKDRDCVGLKIL